MPGSASHTAGTQLIAGIALNTSPPLPKFISTVKLKVHDAGGARGHRAEAGLDVVVETVRLVDDAKLLHFDSEHLRELMQRGRPHLLDEPAGHQQRLEARFLAEAEVLAADELRGVVAPPAELEYANAVDSVRSGQRCDREIGSRPA